MLIKGFVEVRLLNKDTLEVEQVIEQENTITMRMRDRFTTNAVSSSTPGLLIGLSLIISNDANDSVPDFWFVRAPIFGFTPVGVTSPQLFPKTQSTPLYVQWVRRFDPPAIGQTRNINTIGLTEQTITTAGSDKAPVNAYVKLISTCVQTDTQLLDVTYRVQWIRDPAKTQGFTSADAPLQAQVQNAVAYSGSMVPSIIYHQPWLMQNTPETGKHCLGIVNSVGVANPNFTIGGGVATGAAGQTVSDNYPLFKRTLVGTGTTSATVGTIYATEAYLTNDGYVHSWKTITAPSGSKVQPIHSHTSATFTSTTASPFLDSQPSLGTGRLVGGGTWTDPAYPEEYMVKLTAGGAVGIATYQFWKRDHFGFVGTSYLNRHSQMLALTSKGLTTTYSPVINNPITGGHGVLEPFGAESYTYGGLGVRAAVYSYTKFVTSDATGITLIDIKTSDYRNYDSTTTPALPVTSVRQVSVDRSTGIMWVACANTGLWKISADGNTVTHITIAGNGVPSEQAYGVDIGRLNSIWAAFDGGLASSFDGGTTWTTYNTSTTPAFNFTGITDNNWNTINYLKVDPQHADDRMALVRRPNAVALPTAAVVWWSRGVPTTSSVVLNDSFSYNSRSTTLGLDVSDQDGFWVMSAGGYPAQGTNPMRKLTYGAGTTTNVGVAVYGNLVAFERGPAGQTCLLHLSGTSTPYTVAMYDINLTAVIVPTSVSTGTEGSLVDNYNTRYMYLGKGVVTATRSSTTTLSLCVLAQVVGTVFDTSSSLSGPFSYLIWDKYGWNGAAWELNHAGSKTTHAGAEPLLNGITMSFVNGATGTSFIINDYYTFGVVNGILKDNSISYTSNNSFYFNPTKTGTTFGGVVRTYPSVGTVTWKRKSSMLTINPNNSLVNTSTSRQYALYAISNNRVFGDFSVTGTIGTGGTRNISIGLTTTRSGVVSDLTTWTTTAAWSDIHKFSITDNIIRPYAYGVASGTTTNIVGTTTWEIKRVGGTVSYLVGGVVKHTVASTEHSFAVRVLYGQPDSGLNSQVQETVPPITVVSSGVGYYTEAGTLAGSTGVYDPDFLSIDVHATSLPAITLALDGVPVTVKQGNGSTMPSAGEVNIIGEYGDFIFNAADVGKTVTGSYLYVTK